MKQTFYQWIIKQKKRIDPIGDFARDVQRPPRQPGMGGAPRGDAGFYQWEGYLKDNHACDGALKALDKAYSMYLQVQNNNH